MAVEGGGGAATVGGATYQSAVAAFFIFSALYDFETELFRGEQPRTFSFETANPVDDINIDVENNMTAYLQVKRKLSFSLTAEQDLYECLNQFVRQYLQDQTPHSFVIVTTSESSRRVTVSMPSIISAISSGPTTNFRRDQNKALVHDLDLLLSTIQAIYLKQNGNQLGQDEALELLKKIRVCTLDLAPGGSIEQAVFIALNAKGCVSPPLFWGNLIADCSNFAAARRSLTAQFLLERYSPYFSSKNLSQKIDNRASAKKILEVVSSGEIPTDLPLNFHPAAIRASANVTPFGAVSVPA